MFDKKLFLSLCEKYGVEFSETATKPMVKLDSNYLPINKEVLITLFSPHQTLFAYSTNNSNMLIDANRFCPLTENFAIAC